MKGKRVNPTLIYNNKATIHKPIAFFAWDFDGAPMISKILLLGRHDKGVDSIERHREQLFLFSFV